MHWITKLLVALTAGLSVALATLTMAYAVNADRVANALRAEQAARVADRASREAAMASFGQLEMEMTSELDRLKRDLSGSQQRLREAQVALTQVEGERAEARREAQAIASEISEISKTVATQASLIDRLNDENVRLRESDVRGRRETLELADQLNEREARLAVLNQTIRQLELQIQDLRQRLASAGGGVDIARERYTGQVSDVRRDPGSERTLVSVNLGSSDGIQPHSQLYVTRDNNWVANVQIERVDVNGSVGVVQQTAPNQAVRRGDRVTTSLDRP